MSYNFQREMSLSNIDLIVLGILTETPMSAYELTQYITDRQVSSFLKISDPAIYKSCKRLSQEGFLDGKLGKEGKSPKKTIYTINPEGQTRFHELMKFYSGNTNQWHLEFNAFMWHIEKLGKKEGMFMLKDLAERLRTKKTMLKKHLVDLTPYIPFSARTILRQYTMVTTTMVIWVDETIEEYEKLRSPGKKKFDVPEVIRINEEIKTSRKIKETK